MGFAADREAPHGEGDVGHCDRASHQAVLQNVEPAERHDGEDAPGIELVETVADDLGPGLLKQGDARQAGPAVVRRNAVLPAVVEQDRRECAADAIGGNERSRDARSENGEPEPCPERFDEIAFDNEACGVGAQNAMLRSGERVLRNDSGKNRAGILPSAPADLDGDRPQDIELLHGAANEIAGDFAEGAGHPDADVEPAVVADAVTGNPATVRRDVDRHRPRGGVAFGQSTDRGRNCPLRTTDRPANSPLPNG